MLTYAIEHDPPLSGSIVKLLIEHGATIEQESSLLISQMIDRGQIEIVSVLLDTLVLDEKVRESFVVSYIHIC